MSKEKVLEVVAKYDEDATWLCGDEVYTREEMTVQAAVIAEEYAVKIETGDFCGSIEDYISSFSNG
jgi:hypothetical protein